MVAGQELHRCGSGGGSGCLLMLFEKGPSLHTDAACTFSVPREQLERVRWPEIQHWPRGTPAGCQQRGEDHTLSEGTTNHAPHHQKNPQNPRRKSAGSSDLICQSGPRHRTHQSQICWTMSANLVRCQSVSTKTPSSKIRRFVRFESRQTCQSGPPQLRPSLRMRAGSLPSCAIV